MLGYGKIPSANLDLHDAATYFTSRAGIIIATEGNTHTDLFSIHLAGCSLRTDNRSPGTTTVRCTIIFSEHLVIFTGVFGDNVFSNRIVKSKDSGSSWIVSTISFTAYLRLTNP